MDKGLFIVAALAVLPVLIVLIIGIRSYAKGGEFHAKNANRLMRWRVILQALAVLIILGYVTWFGGR